MVHTRNGSSYSVQPDGPGKGRVKTRIRSTKSSSRKTCLEDARASPHSPRSVPINYDVNSELELIEGNILRAEPLPSGSHRNISVPTQNFVQISKRGGVGNIPKPLEGGHGLLLTHQELSGSGEDHRTLRRVDLIFLQRQEEGIGNDLRCGRRPSGIYQLILRRVQRQAQRTPEEVERSQEPSRKGKRQSQLAQTLRTGVQDPQIGAFSRGQCHQAKSCVNHWKLTACQANFKQDKS
ncbi:hypothetical protein O181_103800 [Austropuccinia psidii MF-1]|uniref:Uncharacterized protein n=1 Tax=Austropuccinia psidii MF-1 TaxID=1389203 RepID=A0A9Q3JMA2_9BASI|nr:hypothetical protein [Austropuccinia psidii MF-1]